MSNSKLLCVVFAVLALQAYCNPQWNEDALSIRPNLYNTVEVIPVPPITAIVDLLTGPAPGTNLLCLGVRYAANETNVISVFNTTTLSVIREFLDIGSFYPLDTVAVVSLYGSVFYTAVVTDRKGLKQILGFPMLSEDYFPDLIQITTNTDNNIQYKVHQILAHGMNPVVIYDEINHDEATLYVTLIDTQKKVANQRIFVVAGQVHNITCDLDLDNSGILCLYKKDNSLYRAYVPITKENSTPIIGKLASDDLSSPDGANFIPQAVVASKGYFAHLSARQISGKTELLARVFDPKGDHSQDVFDSYTDVEALKTFDTLDAKPLQGVLQHGDNFAAYYRNVNADGNQIWHYSVYDRDIAVVGDEVQIAVVPGVDSGFRVAREFGNGAVNIAAHTVVNWHGAYVLNLYYGQILSQTPQ